MCPRRAFEWRCGSRCAVSNSARLILASVSAYRPPDGAAYREGVGEGQERASPRLGERGSPRPRWSSALMAIAAVLPA